MVTFDSALPTLVQVCETAPDVAAVERWCAVRDLRGRIRLVLKPRRDAAPPDTRGLAGRLSAALGDWFAPPIWLTNATGDEGRLASKALEVSQPWEPEYEAAGTGTRVVLTDGRWRKLERRLSKEEWLMGEPRQPPWELGQGPSIVTFYSFKGGVGRTTALTSCAWQLAAEGKRVAVIDLDLEAPGLAALLEVQTSRGVIDFIVDFLATRSRDLWDMHAPASILGLQQANLLEVFPAGNLGVAYLEKLARLDFLSTHELQPRTSPVEEALRALLHAIRADLAPDYILIDSRAGLHDLAGLSLHGLAHIDVLVGRASEQSYRGLGLTVQALARRKGPERLLCVVVHTLAPADPRSPVSLEEERAFRKRSYSIFCEHVYGENAPQEEASDLAHSPWVIRYDSALERFTSINGIQPALFTEGYRRLRERLVELSKPGSRQEAVT